MATRFRPTIVPMDCDQLDQDAGPVLLRLTGKGKLFFVNWDHETDAAFEVIGWPASELSPCYQLYDAGLDKIVSTAINNPTKLTKNVEDGTWPLPSKILKELLRAGDLIRKKKPFLEGAAVEAFERMSYRKPSSRWVDRAGTEFEYIFTSGTPYVEGETSKVWHSAYRKRNYPGTLLTITLKTNIDDYEKLLRHVPNGVVYDPKMNTWCLAAAIVEVIDQDSIIVIAGKQSRGLSVVSKEALINKDGNDWFVKRWL